MSNVGMNKLKMSNVGMNKLHMNKVKRSARRARMRRLGSRGFFDDFIETAVILIAIVIGIAVLFAQSFPKDKGPTQPELDSEHIDIIINTMDALRGPLDWKDSNAAVETIGELLIYSVDRDGRLVGIVEQPTDSLSGNQLRRALEENREIPRIKATFSDYDAKVNPLIKSHNIYITPDPIKEIKQYHSKHMAQVKTTERFQLPYPSGAREQWIAFLLRDEVEWE